MVRINPVYIDTTNQTREVVFEGREESSSSQALWSEDGNAIRYFNLAGNRVPNVALGGSGMKNVATLLGLSGYKGILNFTKVGILVNKNGVPHLKLIEEREFLKGEIKPEYTFNPFRGDRDGHHDMFLESQHHKSAKPKVLLGAEIILFKIWELFGLDSSFENPNEDIFRSNIQNRIQGILSESKVSLLKSTKKIVKDEDEKYVDLRIGKYLFNVPERVAAQYAIKTLQGIDTDVSVVSDKFSTVFSLANLELEDYKRLLATVPDYCVVLHPNHRPGMVIKTEEMVSRMTSAYADLYNCVNNRTTYQEYFSRKKFLNELYRYYFRVTVESDYTGNMKYNSSLKTTEKNESILEKLKAKEGLIRSYMLGKRVDYSGGSVITTNINLGLNQVGLPFEVIATLTDITEEALCEKLDLNQLPKEIAKGPNEDTVAKVEAYLKSTDENGRKLFPYSILNRAPTLHLLSMVGFENTLSMSRGIELHPLVCEGFNADFDGDQMSIHRPLSEGAINEVIMMTPSRRKGHPASGKLTFYPRHEMVYGMYVLSKTTEFEGGTPPTKISKREGDTNLFKVLKDLICNQKIQPWDIIKNQGTEMTAGRLLLKFLLMVETNEELEKLIPTGTTISKKNVKPLIDKMVSRVRETVKSRVPEGTVEYEIQYSDLLQTRLKELLKVANTVATLYAPAVSILIDIDKKISNPFEEFDKSIAKLKEPLDFGILSISQYSKEFSMLLDKVTKNIDTEIEKFTYEDGQGVTKIHGYKELVTSGARGDISNLSQLFAGKGQTIRSGAESFSIAVKSSYLNQLSPTEAFMSAFGARKGMNDKVNKTADTGYVNRLMFDAAIDVVITEEDCGANPIILTGADIYDRVEKVDDVIPTIKGIILGRNVVWLNNIIKLETQEMVDAYIESINTGDILKLEVKYRSPMGCLNPCCKVCYGDSLITGYEPDLYTRVGIQAGQAIGEPATQLNLRSFQKGGRKTSSRPLESDFKVLQTLVKNEDVANLSIYEPIAPIDGEVEITPGKDGRVNVNIIGEEGAVFAGSCYRDQDFKTHVKAGEGVKKYGGIKSPREILSIKGRAAAVKYIAVTTFLAYKNQADINFKHFEVLANSLCPFKVLGFRTASARDVLESLGVLPGGYVQLYKIPKELLGSVYLGTNLVGANKSHLNRSEVLDKISVERLSEGLSRAYLGKEHDSLSSAMSQMMRGYVEQVPGIVLTKEQLKLINKESNIELLNKERTNYSTNTYGIDYSFDEDEDAALGFYAEESTSIDEEEIEEAMEIEERISYTGYPTLAQEVGLRR